MEAHKEAAHDQIHDSPSARPHLRPSLGGHPPSLPKWTQRGSARSFLEAVAFRARTGCPWRDLPERFGRWHKIYVRFDQWSKKGWFKLLHAAALEHAGVDISQASLDSTASKLHKAAHGSKKKAKPSASPKADGRPRSTPSPTARAKRSGSS